MGISHGTRMGIVVLLGVMAAVTLVCSPFIYTAFEGKSSKANAPSGSQAIETKEVIGQVASTALVATGSGKIAYAVYVQELNGVVSLEADNCPLLAMGDVVVMVHVRGTGSWYTYVRRTK